MNSALILVLSALGLAAHGIKGNVELMVVIHLIGAAPVGKLAGAILRRKTFRAQPPAHVGCHHHDYGTEGGV